MLQLQRNSDNNWSVTRDGETVKSGLTMLEANRLYAQLIGAALEQAGKTKKRRVFAGR